MKMDDDTAVAKALTTLRRLNVPHCVIYNGVTYGDLQPGLQHKRKTRVNDLVPFYKGVIEALQEEQAHDFPLMPAEQAERLRSSISNRCYVLYGRGSCETKLTRTEDGQAYLTVRRLFKLSNPTE